MKVILLEKIHNLGNIGDHINIRNGYARNYLIPQGKAVTANEDNIKHFNEIHKELKITEAKHLINIKKRASILENLHITIKALAAKEGKLYGSIAINEIFAAIMEAGYEVKLNEIILNNPIKVLGDYNVFLKLHEEVTIKIKLSIISGE